MKCPTSAQQEPRQCWGGLRELVSTGGNNKSSIASTSSARTNSEVKTLYFFLIITNKQISLIVLQRLHLKGRILFHTRKNWKREAPWHSVNFLTHTSGRWWERVSWGISAHCSTTKCSRTFKWISSSADLELPSRILVGILTVITALPTWINVKQPVRLNMWVRVSLHDVKILHSKSQVALSGEYWQLLLLSGNRSL